MFIVTDKWLEDNRTSSGGYNNPQVMSLGWEEGMATVEWKKKSQGKEITLWQKKLFETLAGYKQNTAKDRAVKDNLAKDKPAKVKPKKTKKVASPPIGLEDRLRTLADCRQQDVLETPW